MATKKVNMNQKDYDYTYPKRTTIFEFGKEYYVGTHVSDVFESESALNIEITLSNFQKSMLKILKVNDDMISFRFSQKLIENEGYKKDLLIPIKYSLPTYQNNDKEIKIKMGKDFFIIKKNPIQFLIVDSKNNIKMQSYLRSGFKSFFSNNIAPAIGWKRKNDNLFLPFMSFQIANDENIYGLGEKYHKFEKTKVSTTIWNSDNSTVANTDIAYGGIPLIYSSKNYGILALTGRKSFFDIGDTVTDALSFMLTDEYLNLYFFSGDSIKDLVTKYTELTGRITQVPSRAYGTWMSKLYYHSKDEVEEVIRDSIKNKIKVDVINVDPKWLKERYTKSTNFDFDEARFGKPKDFFNFANKHDVSICFWINPYIQADNKEFYLKAKKNNFLVKSNLENKEYANAYTGTETYQKNLNIIDLTNPDATKFWKSELVKLFKAGLRFVKPDYGDGIPADALFHNNKTGLEMRQIYTTLYRKASYEAGVSVYGKGNFSIFARPAYIGSHRYPGKWNGDSASRFSELKIGLQSGLSSAICGEVLWGTDIGGFTGDPSDELYIRWMQFGSMTPYTRFHGMRSRREPWAFSKKVIDISRKYLENKKTLLPMYKIAEYKSAKKGWPILRPLVFEFQEDHMVRTIDDSFMIGSNIFVSPVIVPKQTSKQIYFPGTKQEVWYDYYNHKNIYVSNRSYDIKTPIDYLPIFIKSNSVLIRFDKGNYSFEKMNKLKLNIDIFKLKRSKTLKFKIDDITIAVAISLKNKTALVKSTNKEKLFFEINELNWID